MNKVVAEVLLAYTTGNGAVSKAAASRAQAEALPFQAGKIRAEEIMYSYALQAKELAKAVGTLKEKAVEIAGASQPLQRPMTSKRNLGLLTKLQNVRQRMQLIKQIRVEV